MHSERGRGAFKEVGTSRMIDLYHKKLAIKAWNKEEMVWKYYKKKLLQDYQFLECLFIKMKCSTVGFSFAPCRNFSSLGNYS